jgi:hypothetical protein
MRQINVKNAYNNNDKMYQQNIIKAYDKNNILIKEFNTIFNTGHRLFEVKLQIINKNNYYFY